MLTPNDFTSLQAIIDYLDAFEYHYNKIATPFDWTFTRHDLEAPIARVARHEPYSSSPPNQLRTNDRNH